MGGSGVNKKRNKEVDVTLRNVCSVRCWSKRSLGGQGDISGGGTWWAEAGMPGLKTEFQSKEEEPGVPWCLLQVDEIHLEDSGGSLGFCFALFWRGWG